MKQISAAKTYKGKIIICHNNFDVDHKVCGLDWIYDFTCVCGQVEHYEESNRIIDDICKTKPASVICSKCHTATVLQNDTRFVHLSR